MGRALRILLLVSLVVSAPISFSAHVSAGQPASATSQPYIVVLQDSVTDPGAVAKELGAALGFQASFVYRQALKGFAASLSASALAAMQSDPRVDSVSVDGPVRATSCVGVNPFVAQCVPQWGDRVNVEGSTARSGNGSGSVNINVAVLDTGVGPHSDLNVVGGVDCSRGTGFQDQNGHGTFVAGMIGAKDNNRGIAGVAPGARIWSVRVLDKTGSGTNKDLICGIDWVTSTRTDRDPRNDIAVANMSIEGAGRDDGSCGRLDHDAVHRAICRSVAAGVTYVVAAGNDGADLKHNIPAAYHEVLTAAGMGDSDGTAGGIGGANQCYPQQADDTYAFFSNFATQPADRAHTVAAPAVCVSSTYVNNQYATGSGTSFASPIVAGTVALCVALGRCAGLTPAQIITRVVADAKSYSTAHTSYGFVGDPIRPVSDAYYGYLIRASLY